MNLSRYVEATWALAMHYRQVRASPSCVLRPVQHIAALCPDQDSIRDYRGSPESKNLAVSFAQICAGSFSQRKRHRVLWGSQEESFAVINHNLHR
jgi:hypothetical protein